MYYIVISIIIILFITIQSFILQTLFKNIANLTQTINKTNTDCNITDTNNNTTNKCNISTRYEYSHKPTQTEYQTIDDVPKFLRIDEFNLREIAKRCTTDTLDLADPKYNLFGKYVTGTYIEGHSDYNKTIKHIKNINSLNFKFCKKIFCLFAEFHNLETIEGLDKIDISNIDYFTCMFKACSSLKSLDISFWDLSFRYIDYMFLGCESLATLTISNESIDTFNENRNKIFGDKTKPLIIVKCN